ncbi:P-loop containing nucleoside triphosphate hydrolase protein [Aspergillus ellipticus CBS 707.79]|uniref:P-loop containing nucleoside triphosphate hydrolase protein n=1 Tax=Aspergillus ellipticus CBS 707.79 TaxID=1448320 RepID=A0A319DQC1_9EURO|nr:P-loop containing nucleoside triphosphate hydrolase protein [Aspergillus ellipticus CBS 707.79]
MTDLSAGGKPDSEQYEQQQPEKYAPAGSICKVHNLDETKRDKNYSTSWTKTPPDNLVEPAENSESGQFALLVRNVKCYDGRKNLEIDSIVVQSEPLKKPLVDVMKDYPHLTMTLQHIQFKKPFIAFVHRWEQLTEARDNETDVTAKAHVDLLYGILKDELGDTIARKNDLVRNGVVTFDMLWTIFEPGQAMYSIVNGRQRAFKLERGRVNQNTKIFTINCQLIDFDGHVFGYAAHGFLVPPFEGTKPITALPVFPLIHHSQHATIREDLIARGKLWLEHKGYYYKQYEGLAVAYFIEREVKYNIKSRVIVDTEAYFTFSPNDSLGVLISISDELSDEQLIITTPVLRGYSLMDKKWLEFFVDDLKDIDLKELILAVARSQSKQLDMFDDVIQGKGRGVVMLLSGPPGNKMKNTLRMVPKWGAVLLLDEADVFMEARNNSKLDRNELVCVFLRVLEYYEGILFLTSNRAEAIDPAFESRIHVSLRYPNLNADSRRHTWTRLLGDADKAFSSGELDKLADISLNGRQIKNILKTASLLASEQGTELSYGHVQIVLKLRVSS